MALEKEIASVQSYVDSGIWKGDSEPSTEKDHILRHIVNVEKHELEYVLGGLGSRLFILAKLIDLDHPSISEIQSGTLSEGGKVFNRVKEILELTPILKDKKLSAITDILRVWVEKNHKKISKTSEKPPPRLIKDVDARNKARESVRIKQIDVSSSYKDFVCAGDSFVPYVRNGCGFQEEVNFLKRSAGNLYDLGIRHTADAASDEIESLTTDTLQGYKGFIKIKMATAAGVLFKVMGGHTDEANKRYLIPQAFYSNRFWRSNRLMDKHGIYEKNLLYCPRAYPLHAFPSKITPYVKDLIDGLEHHAAVNNKPIFDNYWVIAPSVCWMTNGSDGTYEFHDGVTSRKYDSSEKYFLASDKYLTDSKQSHPIILGENITTKNCYFISYWV